MKKSRGFTLIELLAVIIILAIIALIATPIIINVVEDMKTQGFKQTALGYYKAAEYVYNEMFMDGKTENIQFTFQDGKQTSSNSNYKLEVKGETPQGGLVYLTKEGHIAVSINNNKYCAYVDGNKKVTINEDVEHCGYTPVKEGCYSISKQKLSDTNLDGSEDWMTAEYNVLSYKTGSCSRKFDMLIIPSEFEGQKVEGVSFATSKGRTISANDLILPDGLKIVYRQFVNNPSATSTGIKNVIFPDSVIYLCNSAFRRNSLTNITLPSSLKHIGDSAFQLNQLTKVEIPEGVTHIGDYAFQNNQLTSATISDGVKKIGEKAFADNQLISINIPNTVTTIGQSAFENNQLTQVEIPNSVVSIANAVFNNNQLPDDQAFIYARNSDGSEEKTTVVSYGGAKRDNVIIPEGVSEIGCAAFANSSLTSITLPNTLSVIRGKEGGGGYPVWCYGAFANNKLTSIRIPIGTRIESYAFENNVFPNASAITIEGDATRFDDNWTEIGFPAK